MAQSFYFPTRFEFTDLHFRWSNSRQSFVGSVINESRKFKQRMEKEGKKGWPVLLRFGYEGQPVVTIDQLDYILKKYLPKGIPAEARAAIIEARQRTGA